MTLLNLFQQLNPNTQSIFHPLFDVQKIGQINAKSPIVSGDLDGSTARQIVLGIQVGRIYIDAEGIALLVKIMNAEAKVLCALNMIRENKLNEEDVGEIVKIISSRIEILPKYIKDLLQSEQTALNKLSQIKQAEDKVLFAGFQNDEDIQNTMAELVMHLDFGIGHTPFISLGDVAHDRLSNNNDVDRYIREKMKVYGAIFILGNHDMFLQKMCDHAVTNPEFTWAFGCFAKDDATGKNWEIHQNAVFVHAYYDDLKNTLYLHHGLGELIKKDGKRLLPTAFGNYDLSPEDKKFNPVEFVDQINRQPKPRPSSSFENENEKVANIQYFSNFTEFRPIDEHMELTANEIDLNLVYGHNGEISITGGRVTGLNPIKKRLYTVAAVHRGVPDSTTTVATADKKKHKYSGLVADESSKTLKSDVL